MTPEEARICTRRILVRLLVVCLLPSRLSAASGLIGKLPPYPAAPPGIRRARSIDVSPRRLADLRQQEHVLVHHVPLGVGRRVDLDLHQVRPFPSDAKIRVVASDGVHSIPPPATRYFIGQIS